MGCINTKGVLSIFKSIERKSIDMLEDGYVLSDAEITIIDKLRQIDWGKLTVVKKNGRVVMVTPAPDIKVSND